MKLYMISISAANSMQQKLVELFHIKYILSSVSIIKIELYKLFKNELTIQKKAALTAASIL